MPEFLSYNFIVYALVAWSLAAILCSFVWNFVVAGRQAMFSDMLSHTALAGVWVWIFLNISPSITSLIFLSLITILLWFFFKTWKYSQDSIFVLFLTNWLALALLFSHLSKNSSFSFENFLFWNILTINLNEIFILGFFTILILSFILIFWYRFLSITFDKDFALSKSKNSNYFELLFLLFTAITVWVSLKIIWALLISALLVIPALVWKVWSKSFLQNVLISIFIWVLSIWIWVISSFYFDIPSSSAITFSITFLFLISYLIKKIKW